MSRPLTLLALAVCLAASACSLILDFNPKKKTACVTAVDCLAGESCVAGLCQSNGGAGGNAGGSGGASGCGGLTCLATQTCVANVCVNPGCEAVTCAAAETCVGGSCYPTTCAGVTCAQGAVCDNGTCVSASCAGVPCPSGEVCVGGDCKPTQCAGTPCAAGQACFGAQCLDVRCDGLFCSAPGTTCHGGACEMCAAQEVDCTNGVDDDCDGKKDCDDSDCATLACNDKNECTAGETCTSLGTCGSGSPIVCNSPGACQKPTGSCNAATGKCAYEAADAGTACNDGNSCTTGDVCNAGVCGSTMTKPCVTPPAGRCYNAAGTCNPVTGQCSYTLKAAGSACDDANACTTGETCDVQGLCGNGSAKVCSGSPPSECYSATPTCNATTGACGFVPKAAGAACNDGNACTLGDTCNGSGACSPGSPKACNPGECQNGGSCNPANGACSFGNLSNGTACPVNVGPFCRPNWCIDGACVPGFNRADGTAWIFQASARCCGGEAVDIATDARHCGGCFSACGTGVCETVSATACSLAPAATSGRCTCSSGTQCPRSQVCRNVAPYANRCSPNSGANCFSQRYNNLSSCPNFCDPTPL